MPISMSRDLRRIHITGTVGDLGQTDGDSIHLSILGMPNEAIIKRIRIMTGDLTTAATEQINIRVLSDPARYRAAETATAGSGEPYVIFAFGDDVSELSPNTYWLEDTTFADEITLTDDLKTSCFHIMFEAAAALTDVATFTVDVWAEGLPTYMSSQDAGHFGGRRNLQVLRWSTGNLWTNLTREALNPIDEDWDLSLFTAATDYVYFGSPDPIDGIFFNTATANTQIGCTLVTEFWDGSSWTSFTTLYDNCTNANSVAGQEIKFRHPGVITWEAETTWRKAALGDLSLGNPPYDRDDAESYVTNSHWEPKYWLRMNLDDVSPQATFKWIRRAPFI